jgi:HEAT repeat protein
VEELRAALPIDDVASPSEAMLQFRRDNLQKKVDVLKTIGQLRRALALDEWRDDPTRGVVNEKIGPIDTDLRTQVGKRLTGKLQDLGKAGDATNRQAVANLIAEIGSTVRALNPKDRSGYARSLTPLVAALAKDPELHVRQEALRALGNIHAKPKEAAQIFAETLRGDSAPSARRLAADGLGQLVRVVTHLQRKSRTTSGVDASRADVIDTLQQVIQAAAPGFKDADPRVRAAASEALDTAVNAVIELISEPLARKDLPPVGRTLTEAEIREVTLKSAELKQEVDELRPVLVALRAQVADLTGLLGQADATARRAAIETLQNIALARQRLRQRVHSLPNYATVNADNLALLSGADPLESFLQKDLNALAPLLGDSDTRTRKDVVTLLLLVEDRALPLAHLLTASLADSDRTIRWTATRALGNLPAEKIMAAVPALAKILAEPELSMRIAAANTLEMMGPHGRGAAGALAKAATHGDGDGRIAAMHALTALGAEHAQVAVPQLIVVLKERDVEAKVLVAAADTLAQMGALAKDAIPALRRLLGHEESEVRTAASEAILTIGGAGK